MRSETLCATLFLTVGFAACAFAQAKDSCTTLMDIKVTGVEITKAAHVEAGSTAPIPWNQSRSAPVPAYCRVEGVSIGEPLLAARNFGITFALAMSDKWNGDFLMQGGGGSNGIVLAPLGLNPREIILDSFVDSRLRVRTPVRRVTMQDLISVS